MKQNTTGNELSQSNTSIIDLRDMYTKSFFEEINKLSEECKNTKHRVTIEEIITILNKIFETLITWISNKGVSCLFAEKNRKHGWVTIKKESTKGAEINVKSQNISRKYEILYELDGVALLLIRMPDYSFELNYIEVKDLERNHKGILIEQGLEDFDTLLDKFNTTIEIAQTKYNTGKPGTSNNSSFSHTALPLYLLKGGRHSNNYLINSLLNKEVNVFVSENLPHKKTFSIHGEDSRFTISFDLTKKDFLFQERKGTNTTGHFQLSLSEEIESKPRLALEQALNLDKPNLLNPKNTFSKDTVIGFIDTILNNLTITT